MTVDGVRAICLAFPDATEDIKWGVDLAFSVGGKMFCVVNTEPPHQMAFKCSDEAFGELSERPGMRPAPYLARAMWIQEEELGTALDRGELEELLRASYDLVRAKLPKRFRAAAPSTRAAPRRTRTAKRRPSGGRRSRGGPSRARRRRR